MSKCLIFLLIFHDFIQTLANFAKILVVNEQMFDFFIDFSSPPAVDESGRTLGPLRVLDLVLARAAHRDVWARTLPGCTFGFCAFTPECFGTIGLGSSRPSRQTNSPCKIHPGSARNYPKSSSGRCIFRQPPPPQVERRSPREPKTSLISSQFSLIYCSRVICNLISSPRTTAVSGRHHPQQPAHPPATIQPHLCTCNRTVALITSSSPLHRFDTTVVILFLCL